MSFDLDEWINTEHGDWKDRLAGRVEYLRLALAHEMRALRERRGYTDQAALAELLGVKQPAISKLESPNRDHRLSKILEYLTALDADLVMAIRDGDNLIPVTHNVNGRLVVEPPALAPLEHMPPVTTPAVQTWARSAGRNAGAAYRLRGVDCAPAPANTNHELAA